MATSSRALPTLPGKFEDPVLTATGERRAHVALEELETLWFNTGSLCNLACENCYMESSPWNDRLAYLRHADVVRFLDEIRREGYRTREIAFTGGEPFMNPESLAMLEESLSRGFRTLVLTNAMRPMTRWGDRLAEIGDRYRERLVVRVSIDHYSRELHESERGEGSWEPMIDGLRWLAERDFEVAIAGRTFWEEDEESLRAGFARLAERLGLELDAGNPSDLVLFPEMDLEADVPEITRGCWDVLDVSPGEIMCASSRMVVRRRDAEEASVVSCTLLPYSEEFELGATLAEAVKPVSLNHPYCAAFCVLGGGSCSPD